MSAENAARLFLQNYEEVFGLNLQEITDLEVVRIVNSASGSKQVNLRQTVDGLPVFGADFKVGLDKDHAVLSSGGSLYPGLQVSGKASLTVAELVERAAQTVGEWSSDGLPKSAGRVWDNTVYLKDWSETSLAKARKNIAFEPRVLKMDNTPEHRTIVSRGPFQSDIAASQVIFPLTKTQGRLAWRISLHKSMTEWYQVIVDAEDGSLLNRTNLVQFADEQANVFTRNPNATPLSARSLLGTAPATSGSYAFAGSSGQAGNNVFMMIGANEKPGTIHDYTFPFTDSYLNTGALQTIDLATNRKLAFAPNASGGYNMTKAALTAVPAGTNLAMTDDSAVCAPLPFAFQFFGQAVGQVCVNSNGNLTFDAGDPRNFGDPLDLPPRGRIMPLHTDLNPSVGGSVHGDSSVAERLCFTWSGVPEFGLADGSNTFSTCLFSDNTIWLQYPAGGLTSTSAFVGIRPPTKAGTIQPTGASSWTSLNANNSTRGNTGLVRFFPDMGTDEKVLATNLFWQFNKKGHDRLWFYGFDDQAGNFQVDNAGGGIGGDPVILTGIPMKLGTNNAFFGTPPEGECCPFSGFFLFTDPPFRNVHSGFDSDVVLHEYAHGLTNRLVGGPANPVALIAQQSGAMAEGWSDFYVLSYSGDNVIGEYSTGNTATGIREVAYTATNGRNLGQYGNILGPLTGLETARGPFTVSGGNQVFVPEVHADGEIWASLLADVRRALMTAGLTSRQVERLVTEALFFTPSNSSMVEAANALILADVSLNGGSHVCNLWNVLTGRGFGKHAANNDVDPFFLFSGASFSVFASRDRPAGCGGSFSRGTLKHAANFDAAVVGATSAKAWTGDGLWHISARRSTTGARSFYYGMEATGNYATGATTFGSLVSPVLNLAATTNPVLEFDIAMDNFRDSSDFFPFDTVWVQLSTDSGATFPVQRSILSYTTFDFFYGDITFQRIRIDLSPLKGISTAKIRLYFDSLNNINNSNEGVYVDNIQVRDYVEN
ncbi:MAG: M36 family metallopeptidase [Methylococcales bacterium]